MRNKILAIAAHTRALSKNSFVRYAISGCLNTGLSFAVYSAGILLRLNYTAANFIAWIVSVFVAFLLASRYVFQEKSGWYKRLPMFVLSNIVSLIVSTLALSVFIRTFSINPISASVITIPIVVAVNYIALKHVVFR